MYKKANNEKETKKDALTEQATTRSQSEFPRRFKMLQVQSLSHMYSWSFQCIDDDKEGAHALYPFFWVFFDYIKQLMNCFKRCVYKIVYIDSIKHYEFAFQPIKYIHQWNQWMLLPSWYLFFSPRIMMPCT
jgi:hypothetical protein